MSRKIRELYTKKGIKPPNGKGIHTRKFHEVATAIKRDNPAYLMRRAYRIAMGKLGRNRAVKRSHWRPKKRR